MQTDSLATFTLQQKVTHLMTEFGMPEMSATDIKLLLAMQ